MKLTLENLHMYCDEVGECLYWAQGVNSAGYPNAKIDGKTTMIKRHVFKLATGMQLDKMQLVSSRCGHKLCVTPGCLFATTHSAIIKKQYKSGARNKAFEYPSRLARAKMTGKAKVNEEIVAAIRALPQGTSAAEAAAQFGIHKSTANNIMTGRSWKTCVNSASVFNWNGGAK